jgi:hypothetical protein
MRLDSHRPIQVLWHPTDHQRRSANLVSFLRNTRSPGKPCEQAARQPILFSHDQDPLQTNGQLDSLTPDGRVPWITC